ncbi:MAG: sugar O-acetyltransferase [Bacteroidales bacterium]
MKTEKEKAESGELYNANHDVQLIRERSICKNLCYEYNRFKPDALNERNALIKTLLGKIGSNFLIEQPFLCDYGYNIEIGDNFYSNHNLIILDGAKVKIGSNVFIAPNCGIYTAGHPMDVSLRNEGLEYAYPVTIGDNVWIGAGVSVLPGVTIGSGCVIGAGSVVNKDIPPGVLAVGNPVRIIRQIG